MPLDSARNAQGAVRPPASLFLGALLLCGSLASLAGGAPAVAAAQLVPVAAAPRWRTLPATAEPGGRSGSSPGGGWRGVALATPAPRSSLIPAASGALATASPQRPATPADLLPADAQAVAAARIQPPYLLRPSLGGGVPTGYVSGWGDYYIAGSAGTPGNLRDGVPDGSINMGFGIGDPVKSLGLEVNWGIGSIQNLNANGSVALAAGRVLVNRPDLQVSLAGGVLDAYSYGNEPGQTPINGYGALTVALPLQPSHPSFRRTLQLTAGGGGSSFGAIDANFQTTEAGFFLAAGVEVLPNVGVSLGQSSRSTNLNLSYVPFRTLPIFVNLLAADVFDATPFGTVGVLTIGWGDSLQRGFFGN